MIEVDDKALTGLTFSDLFCGIGGFHLALKSFGAKCVLCSEIDQKACAVYKTNFGIMPQGDIKSIPDEQIPTHDILCAGFPCQPYSISGNLLGLEDDRGKLFYEIIRIAKKALPRVIILENVANLKNHDGGATFRKMKSSFEEIGYSVFSSVLDSSDFGIPQARKRLFIVCFLKSLNVVNFIFPKGKKTDLCVRDIVCDESSKYDVFVDLNYSISPSQKVREHGIRRVGIIGSGRQGERVYSLDGYSSTLSSQSGGYGGKTGLYLDGNAVRKLYPRECARLMGFPDSFAYEKSNSVCYSQFGNSVVVDVVQNVVLAIIEQTNWRGENGICKL